MLPRWNHETISQLYALPFIDLLLQAQTIHRKNFTANEVQLCTLLSIKTGACPEDCAYCTQSGHYKTELKKEKLLTVAAVISKATLAKKNGATRFCMGAAWRNPPKKDFPQVLAMIKAVKELGLETCTTLGMLDDEQVSQLKAAGLDYYNHNLDTSADHYQKIITTHTYQDRLDTLNRVRQADINVCCGGIMGLGENQDDRIALLVQLANLEKPPESVPINRLVVMKGTPLEQMTPVDNIDFIRTIAVARIVMPTSYVRLSAGRENMSAEMQALCFLAGANSIHTGDKLLTISNPSLEQDQQLLTKLGLKPQQHSETVLC
jgi:biotin synthase